MPLTPISVKAKLIIIALVAVRSSLYFTKMPNTTMLLKILITPAKTEKGKLYKRYTRQSYTHRRKWRLLQYVRKKISFQSSAILQRGRYLKRRKKLFQLGNLHVDSVSTNRGTFAKSKTFNAMMTSIAEIQMHLGLRFKHWPPSTVLTSMAEKNAGWWQAKKKKALGKKLMHLI